MEEYWEEIHVVSKDTFSTTYLQNCCRNDDGSGNSGPHSSDSRAAADNDGDVECYVCENGRKRRRSNLGTTRLIRRRVDTSDDEFVIISERYVSGPENTVSVPEDTVSVPENTVSVPENTVSVPENTVSVPENTVWVPQNAPDYADSGPDSTHSGPGSAPDSADCGPGSTPDSAEDVDIESYICENGLERCQSSLGTTRIIRRSVDNSDDELVIISERCVSGPENTVSVRENTVSVPENTVSVLENTVWVPQKEPSESSSVSHSGVGLSCPVCFTSQDEIAAIGRHFVATPCGHMFCCKCTEDITKKGNGLCPTCRAEFERSTLLRIYL